MKQRDAATRIAQMNENHGQNIDSIHINQEKAITLASGANVQRRQRNKKYKNE